MISKTNQFIFDKIKVFFKQTDYHGYVHAYNYFEWTSYVREAFFTEKVRSFSRINKTTKMMTSKISLTLVRNLSFGDEIKACFTVTRIKRCSFDVIIRFVSIDSELVATTRHTLVFIDEETEDFISIPKDLRDVIVEYNEDG